MEKKPFSTRAKARIILYSATLVLVLGILCVVQTVKANRYERETLLARQMALVSLDENLNNIATNLEKTIYVNSSSMLSKLSSELWRETSGAKLSLGMLPTGDTAVSNTYKFLSQIGEFVMALERKSAEGKKLSTEERKQLTELYSYCQKLNQQISQMCYDMENGNFSFESVDSTITDKNIDMRTFNQGFDDTEQSLTDLPTLIYDGPFSDHLLQNEAKFLKGQQTVSRDEAKKIAEKLCENEKDSITYAYDEDSDIPCYVFECKSHTIAITKTGGKPCYMIGSGYAGEVQLKYEDAVEKAKAYLNKIGYENMKETYYFAEDGICTVNFAAVDGDIILYPDLIKVSVNLENGEIISFDATGYISNHTERDNLTPKIDYYKAQETITDNLQIMEKQICVIPTDWKTEQLCYEFHCKSEDNKELLIYIDCTTGEEDNILILLYSDNGVLTK